MFVETITLFNRYHSKLGDVWYPHVLHNIEINKDKASIMAIYGAESKDSAKLFIPYTYETLTEYIETLDIIMDASKTYYVDNNGVYDITIDTSFSDGVTYYEQHIFDAQTINGIPYYPPKIWAEQTNDKLGKSITLNDDGQYFDFFITGDAGYNAPINDEAYAKGFYNELNKSLDYCYAITSVGEYKLIPHFEIMAK